MKSFLLFCCSLIGLNFSFAQELETTPPEYIKTVQFMGEEEFAGTPILRLGSPIVLTFDDLIGDEADYYYTIEHYNFDWKPSNLSKNEYLDGLDNLRILTYKNSFNSLQIYSHYTLQIPNRNTKGIKVSGNYMLKIWSADRKLVFSRKFMVYEDIALVRAQVRRTRDLKYVHEKQILNFSIDGSDKIIFRNPNENLKTLIIPNNNLQMSIYNLKPQFTIGNEMVYKYDQEASFWGGNEFLFFDTSDFRGSSMNIRAIELKNIYNTYLYSDKSRKNDPYTYNPDINGSFRINAIQGEDDDVESEYTWVHFTLFNYDDLEGGEIHVYGNFNNYTISNETKLSYDEKNEVYFGKHLFKQGFYNYKYVLVNQDGSIDETFFSGSFDETENQYVILAYYRDVGGRYDRIIGVGSANSRNITN
ncbi:DUF5103 domain-containing protein [Mesonia sp. K7]|uniref:type IX secretion system plug protein n=1 Tax=Mesonia sp. K7 TaxID=2218606 RepID=UPI000DA7ED7B|nr:DUF5103 domain-containing protein [Mesonia sp. K7]PZD77625.1 DUF5103 domain-containing protein [Mesonia sp. K7]